MESLESIAAEIAEQKAKYVYACKKRREEKESLASAVDRLQAVEDAQQLVQHVAQEIQQRAHERIARVVSRCLAAVFEDEAYGFKIDFQRKRGKTEARLLFTRDGKELDPLKQAGGGAVDVASFALRLACVMLQQPPGRRLLVLDEPFKNLSEQYRPRVCEMLETLAEEMDTQFVLVTHFEDLQTGKVIEL